MHCISRKFKNIINKMSRYLGFNDSTYIDIGFFGFYIDKYGNPLDLPWSWRYYVDKNENYHYTRISHKSTVIFQKHSEIPRDAVAIHERYLE